MNLTTAELREKYFKRNFVFFVLDNVFFCFVISILSQVTILPYFVESLTDSKVAVALIPALAIIGYNITPFLGTLHCVRSHHKRRLMMWLSVIQRITIALIALSAGIVKVSSPTVSLVLFLVAYLLYNMSNGYMAPIWNQVFASAINRKRGLYVGLNSSLGSILGFLFGFVVADILANIAYPNNFIYMFGVATIAGIISTTCLGQVKVVEDPSEVNSEFTLKKLFSKIPDILKTDVKYKRFLSARIFIALGEISFSFFVGKMILDFAAGDSTVGTANIIIMIFQAIFSIIWGVLGDKKGFNIVFIGIGIVGLTASILALTAPTVVVYLACFAMVGMIMRSIQDANTNCILHYSPPDSVSLYSSLTALILLPFNGILVIIIGAFADILGYPIIFITSGLGFLIGAILFFRNYKLEKQDKE